MRNIKRQVTWLSIVPVVGVVLSNLCTAAAQAATLHVYNGYSQNFDSLNNSNTNVSAPGGLVLADGWYIGGTSYDANNSGNNGYYSYGSGNSTTERALGSIGSGQIFGVQFTVGSNHPDPITSLLISYRGEQWRGGKENDRLDFQYSTDATSLTSGSWLNADPLDFIAPDTTTNGSTLDGNTAPNFTNISGTISGFTLNSGSTLWLRWLHTSGTSNGAGGKNGLAIDDFRVAAIPTPSLLPGLVTVGLGLLRKREMEKAEA